MCTNFTHHLHPSQREQANKSMPGKNRIKIVSSLNKKLYSTVYFFRSNPIKKNIEYLLLINDFSVQLKYNTDAKVFRLF